MSPKANSRPAGSPESDACLRAALHNAVGKGQDRNIERVERVFSATPWYFRRFSPEGSISGKMLRPSPGTGNAPCSEVVNEGLATRFAEKLAQMRCDSQGQFVTPSLVFHGAPSQELFCVVLPQLATAITFLLAVTDIDLKRDASGTAGLNRRLSTFEDFEVLDLPVKWLIAFSRQQWVTPKARSSEQELSRQWA